MEDKKNISRSYIGKDIVVTASPNATLVGCKGVVLDETKQSFLIKTVEGSRKRVLKRKTTFAIGDFVVNGDTISKRPEERIKSRGK